MGREGSPWLASIIVSLVVSFAINASIMSVMSQTDDGPTNFKYIHLWASQDGETHIRDCKMDNFTLEPYSALPQYTRSDFGGPPTKVVFTELPIGFTQPLHSPPAVQFVTTLAGSWYITTSDNATRIMRRGNVLFQDNVKSLPTNKVPQHYSGVTGNATCQQLIVQLNQTIPTLDHPCPF